MSVVKCLAIAVILAACTPDASPTPAGVIGLLEVVAVAGPVCPVETDPPDPDCAPRPVSGARILVSPGDGRDIVVAQGVTDDEGRAVFELPPGDYLVSGAEVAGLMGVPELAAATVSADATTSLTLAYDTGIR
jgi:hypothetical protein